MKNLNVGNWVLRMCEHLRGTPKYFTIVTEVKNKVLGTTDDILDTKDVSLNWEARVTLKKYYENIQKHLKIIIDKINIMLPNLEVAKAQKQYYRCRALDSYIRRLNQLIGAHVVTARPTYLAEACEIS